MSGSCAPRRRNCDERIFAGIIISCLDHHWDSDRFFNCYCCPGGSHGSSLHSGDYGADENVQRLEFVCSIGCALVHPGCQSDEQRADFTKTDRLFHRNRRSYSWRPGACQYSCIDDFCRSIRFLNGRHGRSRENFNPEHDEHRL